MSYEGYTEFLCEKGHRWIVDVHSIDRAHEERQCKWCKRPPVWGNGVDVTNGECFLPNGKPDPRTVPADLKRVGYQNVTIKIPVYEIPHTRKPRS